MSSRAPPSLGSCSIEATKYAWRSPPNIIGFVESAGLAAVPHGPDHVVQNANIARIYGKTPNPSPWPWKS
jgi:hypothetical protein